MKMKADAQEKLEAAKCCRNCYYRAPKPYQGVPYRWRCLEPHTPSNYPIVVHGNDSCQHWRKRTPALAETAEEARV